MVVCCFFLLFLVDPFSSKLWHSFCRFRFSCFLEGHVYGFPLKNSFIFFGLCSSFHCDLAVGMTWPFPLSKVFACTRVTPWCLPIICVLPGFTGRNSGTKNWEKSLKRKQTSENSLSSSEWGLKHPIMVVWLLL